MRKCFSALVCALLLVLFIAQPARASFAADRDALVYDSDYFRDRGFDNASALLERAQNRSGASFILVFYSRKDSVSKMLMPEIQEWAEREHIPVFGIDQYNKYTQEYGYFNAKTALESWENFLDRRSFAFPAVFVYNGNTRCMVAESGLRSVSRLSELVDSVITHEEEPHEIALAEEYARQLYMLDLFKGTGKDFELERAPSRVEALTMLIRLLGKEEEALTFSWEHPFTDVPFWANGYVGYAYATGIAQGISGTLFGSLELVSAQHYLTFALRALGYQSGEGGDFMWDKPFGLAVSCGLLPDGVNTTEFLRADMVIVSRQALTVPLKSTQTLLADKLIRGRRFSAPQLAAATGIERWQYRAADGFAKWEWKSEINIEPVNIADMVDTALAAAWLHPSQITVTVARGMEQQYADYIASALSLPIEQAVMYETSFDDGKIILRPEYTAAGGAAAVLFVKGYSGTEEENMVASAAKGLADKAHGDEKVLLALLEALEEASNEELQASDADSALLLGRANELGRMRTMWLVLEIYKRAQ